MKRKLGTILFAFAAIGVAIAAAAYRPAKTGAFYSSDGSGNDGTWLPMAGSGGTGTPVGRVNAAGLYYSSDGSGHDGTWLPCGANCFGGNGNTTSTGGTTNSLAKFNGANSIINSLVTDDGTTTKYTGTGGTQSTKLTLETTAPSDAGSVSTLQNMYAPADSFNVWSIRSLNANPYMLSAGVNQASGYTELQSWRDTIGFNVPLWLQRQGGTIKVGASCNSGASPAVCSGSPNGAVAIPTGVNPTLTVNTTAVTASSQILLVPDDSLTISGTTCNSTLATLVGGIAITGRSAGTSFTISYNGTITTNPLCLSYLIEN